jgi:hypothetical protein
MAAACFSMSTASLEHVPELRVPCSYRHDKGSEACAMKTTKQPVASPLRWSTPMTLPSNLHKESVQKLA